MTLRRIYISILAMLVLTSASPGTAFADPKPSPGGRSGEQMSGSADPTVVTGGQSPLAIRESLTFSSKPKPTKKFWNRVAQCETGNNWSNGGKWAGGLGIYTLGEFGSAQMGTWEHFGGEEFAPSPDRATREEQIVVANRIAVYGYTTIVHRDPAWAARKGVPVTYVYNKKPSGLGGWGCYKSKHTGKYRMEKPRMFYADQPRLVPLAKFYLHETGKIVEDLQTFLRIKVDGEYGLQTRKAHLKYLRQHGLSTAGVPTIIKHNPH